MWSAQFLYFLFLKKNGWLDFFSDPRRGSVKKMMAPPVSGKKEMSSRFQKRQKSSCAEECFTGMRATEFQTTITSSSMAYTGHGQPPALFGLLPTVGPLPRTRFSMVFYCFFFEKLPWLLLSMHVQRRGLPASSRRNPS